MDQRNGRKMIQIEQRLPTVSEYQSMRNSVGWHLVDEQSIETALSGSLFSVVALENGQIKACARIVGDGSLYFYIQDVMVHPDHQKKGLSKKLMRELMTFIHTNAKTGAFVGLMAAKGLGPYYETFGFKPRDKNAPGMFQIVQ